MATQIPGRRLAKNLRKTENIIPTAHDDASVAAKPAPSRSFARAKSDSKIAFGSSSLTSQSTKSTLLAPTASSRAKVVSADAKGEKRKREALVERGERNRTALSNPTVAAISKPSKPLVALNRKTAHKPHHINHHGSIHHQKDKVTRAVLETIQDAPHREAGYDDDRMQVSDEPIPLPPVLDHDTEDAAHDSNEDDTLQPAAKRQHTLSPQPQEDTDSGREVDEVARHLDPKVDTCEEQIQEEQWEDLDAADADDPAMVSEYVVEIHEYLKNVELEVLPDNGYIEFQPQLEWSHRRDVLDWTYYIHHTFHLQQESWFLTVNIFDRLLTKRQIGPAKMQLCALSSLLVASKFEETYVPSISQMAMWLCTEDQMKNKEYMKKQMALLMAAERYVLQTLGWDLNYPSPLSWLRRGSKADDLDDRTRLIGKYLMDLATMDWRQVGVRPSLLASSALWVSRLILKKPEWTANLAHYTSYTEAEMTTQAAHLINTLLRPKTYYRAVYAKYAGKKYGKASIYCRNWALTRWEAEANVNLNNDLPLIKQDIYNILADRAKVPDDAESEF